MFSASVGFQGLCETNHRARPNQPQGLESIPYQAIIQAQRGLIVFYQDAQGARHAQP
ncbi:hypothetical protein C4J88_2326 [Pseudomonas sp. R4-39-08]|nr:hypothetical protein C4J88_2326 [Pseudomonas sp. R4-39-08]